MAIEVLSREEWGADPALPRKGFLIGPSPRTEVFIHHTVVVDADVTINQWEDRDEIAVQMRRLQTMRPDLGEDVPYTMVAFCMSDGKLILCEGRGLGRTAAHATGHNRSGLGIAFCGNFELAPLPENLDQNLVELGDWLRHLRTDEGFENLGSVRPDDGREVFGHRDVKNTLCPGGHLFSRLHLVRFVADSAWQQPGDPIRTADDERRVIAAHGALSADAIPAAQLRPIAVVLDELMQLRARVERLEAD